MSAVELRVVTGRAVRVDRTKLSGPVLAGGSVPKAIGRWLAQRAGRANGPKVAKYLGLVAAASRPDAAVWVGSVFGCKVVAHQPILCDRSA